MAIYFTIHDMNYPNSREKRLVAICRDEQQARICFDRIIRSTLRMLYIVLERVNANTIGLLVTRMVIDEGWANSREE